MPVDPIFIPSDDDAIFGWKTGGWGGGNPRFKPPGAGVGGGFGGGMGGGGGNIGFDYSPTGGFDPYGDVRKRLASLFGGLGGGQNSGALLKLLTMLGGGGMR